MPNVAIVLAVFALAMVVKAPSRNVPSIYGTSLPSAKSYMTKYLMKRATSNVVYGEFAGRRVLVVNPSAEGEL
jgi:hypothetical protein